MLPRKPILRVVMSGAQYGPTQAEIARERERELSYPRIADKLLAVHPGKLTRATPASSEVVRNLPESCPKAVQKLPPIRANLARARTSIDIVEKHRQNSGWSKLARYRPTRVKLGQVGQHRPQLAALGPKVTSPGQLFDNFETILDFGARKDNRRLLFGMRGEQLCNDFREK